MPSIKVIALILIVGGILANNYTYLHDIFWMNHEGLIGLGSKSYIVIGIGFAAVIVGAVLALAGPRKKPSP